jgi:hypothetical protein
MRVPCPSKSSVADLRSMNALSSNGAPCPTPGSSGLLAADPHDLNHELARDSGIARAGVRPAPASPASVQARGPHRRETTGRRQTTGSSLTSSCRYMLRFTRRGFLPFSAMVSAA